MLYLQILLAARVLPGDASRGKWAHLATIGFEKYLLRKVRNGQTEPLYEKFMLRLMGASRTEQV